jgi:hypothetical protein
MDVFDLREHPTREYANYASSFIEIRDARLRNVVESSLASGTFWPDPLIQLNPSFQPGATADELIAQGILHPECARIFRKGKDQGKSQPLQFHQHQLDAIRVADSGENYILTTGTGSGKSLAYIVPIVNHVLHNGSGNGIQAIVVYPMNALANSQENELRKFLQAGYPENAQPVTFARYTGQENDEQRQRIRAHPPDILLTNYVMLELIMTRPHERPLIERAKGLRFLVLDELHTYRGRQGADVALLMRRVRDRLETQKQRVQYVGTSATLASEGSLGEQRAQIAAVGTQLFGAQVKPECIIGETLQRATPNTDLEDSQFQHELISAIGTGTDLNAPRDYQAFVQHPLSRWIESAFGLEEREGRLVRRAPRSTRGQNGASRMLVELIGLDEERCVQIIQHWLLAAYHCEPNPVTGFPPFAFRLHQFVSPAGTVYSTIEHESRRYVTLNGQQFVPGDRKRVLFPLCFCWECGQEYYVVRRESVHGLHRLVPREFSDRLDDESGEAGYLYISQSNPWPTDLDEIIERLPDDWIEERNNGPRVRSHRRKQLPQHVSVLRNGVEDQDGDQCVYMPAPFSFCLERVSSRLVYIEVTARTEPAQGVQVQG